MNLGIEYMCTIVSFYWEDYIHKWLFGHKLAFDVIVWCRMLNIILTQWIPWMLKGKKKIVICRNLGNSHRSPPSPQKKKKNLIKDKIMVSTKLWEISLVDNWESYFLFLQHSQSFTSRIVIRVQFLTVTFFILILDMYTESAVFPWKDL